MTKQELKEHVEKFCSKVLRYKRDKIKISFSRSKKIVATGYVLSEIPTICISDKNWKTLTTDIPMLDLYILHEIGHHFTLQDLKDSVAIYQAELLANQWAYDFISRYKKYEYLHSVFLKYLKDMTKLKGESEVVQSYKIAAQMLLKEIKQSGRNRSAKGVYKDRGNAVKSVRSSGRTKEGKGSTGNG